MNTDDSAGSAGEEERIFVAKDAGVESIVAYEEEDEGSGAHEGVDDKLNDQISDLCDAMAEEPKSTIVHGIPDSMLFKWRI